MFRNRFHHEVWSVANIRYCSEKHRTNADCFYINRVIYEEVRNLDVAHWYVIACDE